MDSIRKRVFKRSLLSSAVLLSIQTSVAYAGTCPPPNIDNNIHVSRGEVCEGGISPNSPVNDIGIEGYVSGDVVNNDGISDFWISSGTLDGSLINNNTAQHINISNGAIVAGSLVNQGSGEISGNSYGVSVKKSSIGEGIENHGSITGKSGLQVHKSQIEDSILNSGDIEGTRHHGIVVSGNTNIKTSLSNQGTITASKTGILFKNRATTTLLENSVDGAIMAKRIGIQLKNNSSVDELVNDGDIHVTEPANRHTHAGISLEDNSTAGIIINRGEIQVHPGFEHDGEAFDDGYTANGIQVIENASSGNIENYGTISADTYGIYIDGAVVEGNIINAEGGEIRSGDNGIYLNEAYIQGNVTSSGLIISEFDNAIDVEDSQIDGSVQVNGTLTSSTRYDALSIDDSTIIGDVLTGNVNSNTTITGRDGIDIDDTTIDGNVISLSAINAVSDGFDFDNTHVKQDLSNAGIINSGKTGISFVGDIEFPLPEEGEMPVPMLIEEPPVPVINAGKIDGSLNNQGDINAGEQGIEVALSEIGLNFHNSGTVTSTIGTAIHISATSIGNDFVNEGNLFADIEPRYGVGESYDQPWLGAPSESGQMVLESLGVDEYGQAWYKIRNEGPMMQGVQLSDPSGDFISGELILGSGDQIIINGGQYSGDAQTFVLTYPLDEGEPVAEAVVIDQPFIPQEIEATQRGISLIGDYYDDGELELKTR